MKKGKYFSVSEFSRLSGVSPKSLRYYDKIGILKPAVLDPDNGYRYYTLTQIVRAECIKFFAELDIPLSSFKTFYDEENDCLYLEKLFSYSTEQIEKKLSAITINMNKLRDLQAEVLRVTSVSQTNGPVVTHMTGKKLWIEPCAFGFEETGYYKLAKDINKRIGVNGFSSGYEYGLLYQYKNNSLKRYLYHYVYGDAQSDKILILPDTDIVSCKIEKDKLNDPLKIFPELRRSGYAMERAICTSEYYCEKPVFEVAYSPAELDIK